MSTLSSNHVTIEHGGASLFNRDYSISPNEIQLIGALLRSRLESELDGPIHFAIIFLLFDAERTYRYGGKSLSSPCRLLRWLVRCVSALHWRRLGGMQRGRRHPIEKLGRLFPPHDEMKAGAPPWLVWVRFHEVMARAAGFCMFIASPLL